MAAADAGWSDPAEFEIADAGIANTGIPGDELPAWLEAWAPQAVDEIPALSPDTAIPVLYRGLLWALDMAEYPKQLNAGLTANAAPIGLIARYRPDLHAELGRQVQQLRHRLLVALLDAAVDTAALGLVIDQNRKSLDLLARDRPDLVDELRNRFRLRRAAFAAAA